MKKKLISILLAAIVAVSLCACSGGEQNKAAEDKEFVTLGDAFAVDSEMWMSGYDDKDYVYVFEYGGKSLRVSAQLSKEKLEAIDAVDFASEEGFDEIEKIVSDLEITKTEDLSAGIPSDEELSAYIGITGAQLEEAGFSENGWSITDDSTEVYYINGLYNYKVTFEQKIDADSLDDDFNAAEAVSDLTIKTIEYESLSYNCTDLSLVP
ncbi:MAG: hypothetical protein IJG50_03330 [Clostridia bacterium]|nr:hypothetical protein [Clostridia bacterium]